MGSALDYISNIGLNKIIEHEHKLKEYLIKEGYETEMIVDKVKNIEFNTDDIFLKEANKVWNKLSIKELIRQILRDNIYLEVFYNKEFNIETLLNDVKLKFIDSRKDEIDSNINYDIYIYKYNKPNYHISCDEFYNYIKTQEKINI